MHNRSNVIYCSEKSRINMHFSGAMALCLISSVMITSACRASDPAPTVGFYKLDDQRVTGETSVFTDEASFGGLSVLVTIDTTGKVTSAKLLDNFSDLNPTPALTLVRSWAFRPQTFDGKPVNAIGRVSITYQKRPIPADINIPFPVGTPADSAITLQRSACYGSCPDYRVTVHGDGLVEFDTGDDHFKGTAAEVHLQYSGHNVLLPGRHTAHIDPTAVAGLFDKFRAAHFFGLRKEYVYGATDASTQILTVSIGKTSKTVTDYIGTEAGMPEEVRALEEAVDAVAGTARWVDGNAQTLEELDATHFDYHSRDGALLAGAAAAKFNNYRPVAGVESLLIGLVSRGVQLDAKVGKESLGAALIWAAAGQGSEALFDTLAKSGALASISRASLNAAFSNVGCSPKIAQALVKAGADPRTVGEHGTALTALRGTSSTCEGDHDKMVDMARTLIKLGVPLEARDGLGWTALMGCDSPDLAQLLLANGADPKVRTKDGTTAVLSTDDDRVALILLRSGADPRAKNENGSVRTQATKGNMPATLAWLDAHKIP